MSTAAARRGRHHVSVRVHRAHSESCSAALLCNASGSRAAVPSRVRAARCEGQRGTPAEGARGVKCGRSIGRRVARAGCSAVNMTGAVSRTRCWRARRECRRRGGKVGVPVEGRGEVTSGRERRRRQRARLGARATAAGPSKAPQRRRRSQREPNFRPRAHRRFCAGAPNASHAKPCGACVRLPGCGNAAQPQAAMRRWCRRAIAPQGSTRTRRRAVRMSARCRQLLIRRLEPDRASRAAVPARALAQGVQIVTTRARTAHSGRKTINKGRGLASEVLSVIACFCLVDKLAGKRKRRSADYQQCQVPQAMGNGAVAAPWRAINDQKAHLELRPAACAGRRAWIATRHRRSAMPATAGRPRQRAPQPLRPCRTASPPLTLCALRRPAARRPADSGAVPQACSKSTDGAREQ